MIVVVVLFLVSEFDQGCNQFNTCSRSEDIDIVLGLMRRLNKLIIESVLKLPDDAGLGDDLVKSLKVDHLSLFDILRPDILVLINLHKDIYLPTNVGGVIELS